MNYQDLVFAKDIDTVPDVWKSKDTYYIKEKLLVLVELGRVEFIICYVKRWNNGGPDIATF